MTNEHSEQDTVPATAEAIVYGQPVVLESGNWLGLVPFRRLKHRTYTSLYTLPVRWIGCSIHVATDGTPWTHNGKRYLVRASGGILCLPAGKYLVRFTWRGLRPKISP